jgi:photosystem II stability/assembly factor-like uncharacterized protein
MKPHNIKRRVLLLALSLATLLALIPVTTSASPEKTKPYVWKNVKIGGGGFVSGVTFHPTEPNLVYARTDVGGAYVSSNGGLNWTSITDSLGRNDPTGVLAIALSPHNPDIVYLACGLYTNPWDLNAIVLTSYDRGKTWGRAGPLPFRLGGNEDGRGAGERMQVDPNAPNILFLGTNKEGLWKSTDGATTFTKVAAFPQSSITFVLFDERSGQYGTPTPTIYVGVNVTTGPSLYQSTDSGVTWSPVAGQPIPQSGTIIPNRAALDSNRVLYVTYSNQLGPNGITGGDVWKYGTNTNIWTKITPVPATYFGFGAVGVDPQQPGVLMVTTLDRWSPGDGAYRSTNGGLSWTAVGPLSSYSSPTSWIFFHNGASKYIPHWMGDIQIDPYNSSHIMYITGWGLWGSNDLTNADTGAQVHWQFSNEGLEETVPLGLISPPQGVQLISALGDIGGFRHENLDAYSPDSNFFNPVNSTNTWIDFAENQPGTIVRANWGNKRGSWSTDGGLTWTDFATLPAAANTNGPGAIAISSDGNRLLWLPKGAAAYYSTDFGATWTQSTGGTVDPNSWMMMYPTADRVNPNKFYVYDVFNGIVYISINGGVSFTRGAQALPTWTQGILRAVPGREGDLWLPAAGGGLLRSIDSGQSFTRLTTVDEAYQIGFGKAFKGRTYQAIYIWGMVNQTLGVFRSDDAGATWVRLNDDQHQYGWINVIIGDSHKPGRVYLGTGGRGIIYGEPAPAPAIKNPPRNPSNPRPAQQPKRQ